MLIRAIRTVFNELETWPRWRVVALALSIIVLVSYLDYVSGADVNVNVLYIFPVVISTWVIGPRWSAPMALGVVLTMVVIDYLGGSRYASPWVPIWNFGSRFTVFMIVSRVVALFHRSAIQAESLARTDALTGIGNVRYFREAAELEIARAQRYGHPMAIAFIDIDDFKRVNDTFGHEAGDRSLRAIGQAIVQQVRRTDVVARIGGDEFIVLLPMMAPEQAERFVTMLRDRLSQRLEHAPAPLTCSIGVVSYIVPPASVDEMLKQADERRQAAKQDGKDTVRHRVVTQTRESAEPGVMTPAMALSR